MERLKVICIWLCCTALLVSAAMAQSSEQTAAPDMANIAAQLKKLQDEVATQQKALADQQQKIADQQAAIDKLTNQLSTSQNAVVAVAVGGGTPAPHVENAVMVTNGTPETPKMMNDAGTQGSPEKESPLSFRIGGADFTPGGFADFTNIFRSTQTGALGTGFGTIPFSNTVAGHLTENRMMPSNSRLSLKVHSLFGANDVTGYVETDFLGNDANSVNVTSNAHTMRMRMYFVDVRRGKWEFLGGQAWSMLTPNRVGMSPYPDDIFYTKNMDTNYQVGLTWTRAPQFRAIYHPNDNWAIGVGLENPEQYSGTGTTGEITLPFAFNAQLASQLDAGGNNIAPNTMPDITPKITYDNDFDGRHFHAEAAGLITAFKITNLASGNFVHHATVGGGIQFGGNFELVKDFRLVGNAFWSNGGGRYIFGLGPDVVILPNATGTDLSVSTIEADSVVAGLEWQATPRNMFSAYYGGAYFGRNFTADTTPGANPTANVGFGFPNSSSGANRSVQEATLGWTRDFWKSKQYGKLQFITQYSYVTRAPWFVAAGAPKNAHMSMGWLDLRYVLP